MPYNQYKALQVRGAQQWDSGNYNWMLSNKIHTLTRSRFIFHYLSHLLLEHVYKSLTHSFINLLMCDRLKENVKYCIFLKIGLEGGGGEGQTHFQRELQNS